MFVFWQSDKNQGYKNIVQVDSDVFWKQKICNIELWKTAICNNFRFQIHIIWQIKLFCNSNLTMFNSANDAESQNGEFNFSEVSVRHGFIRWKLIDLNFLFQPNFLTKKLDFSNKNLNFNVNLNFILTIKWITFFHVTEKFTRYWCVNCQ